MTSIKASRRRVNEILAGLPLSESRRIRGLLRPISLPAARVLSTPGRPLPAVYFLTQGVCSISRTTRDGRLVEVAMIGNEGLVGIDVLFAESSFSRAIVHVADESALAMPIGTFRQEMRSRGMFAALVHAYAGRFVASVMQSVLCSSLHAVDQRCARWLLTMRDRVDCEEFSFTQESMAAMLGVRRPSVTLAVATLQKRGFIAYGRGWLRILDAAALSRVACECHGVLKKDRVGQPARRGRSGPIRVARPSWRRT